AGDLLVGDRGVCSFIQLAMVLGRGIHDLFRMHQRSIVSLRPRGKKRRKGQRGRPRSRFIRRLGHCDQIAQGFKPTIRPKWISAEQYAALPSSLLVRELRYHIPRRGQRPTCVTIVTTLLDPLLYPKQKIAELYHVRWRVE